MAGQTNVPLYKRKTFTWEHDSKTSLKIIIKNSKILRFSNFPNMSTELKHKPEGGGGGGVCVRGRETPVSASEERQGVHGMKYTKGTLAMSTIHVQKVQMNILMH